MSMLCVKQKQEEKIPCSGDIRDKNLRSLITRKKLHLVLDLDHTLLHTVHTRELTPVDTEYLSHPSLQNWFKEEKLFKVDEIFLTKLRPNVQAFLEEVSRMFDLSIYTLGTKYYANEMVKILDPKGLYITPSNIFSAEDCTRPMVKGLDVVNHHERVVLVVDDMKRVWVDHPRNVIEITPYEFFADRKHSWLRWRGDESEKHGELARVLRELKKIHVAFFDMNVNQVDYETRDVRDVAEDVRKKFRLLR
ncbi:RNA polymerase II C-terminal domain phosphatase-like 4 [Silene latifolia]|uniref:RNA polymerase II C-terminal domain phosphatase-like 4 n=1 Tax=Silene latifolia TaxID=37657 RepID=UPI003D784BEC